jgi:hypothetical protein
MDADWNKALSRDGLILVDSSNNNKGRLDIAGRALAV